MKRLFALVLLAVSAQGQFANASEYSASHNEAKAVSFNIKVDDGSTIYDPSISGAIYSVVNDYLALNRKSSLISDVSAVEAQPGQDGILSLHFQVKKAKKEMRVDLQISMTYTPNEGGEGDGYGYGSYSVNHYQVVGNPEIFKL